jgi:hypothetical protein
MMLFVCFSSAYYLFSGLGDMLSYPIVCRKLERGAAVALVLRSKQKLLPVCYPHTEEIVLSWESKAPQKEGNLI